MFNRKSIYALNKKDPNAIVYVDADGNLIRLTRDDFASEEEFLRWKDWSDNNFHDEENGDHRQANYTVSLEGLSEEAIAVMSVEDYHIAELNANERRELAQYLIHGLHVCLTETQRRRLWKYCVENKTIRAIADEESSYRNAVWKSIDSAKQKINDFLSKKGCAKPGFHGDR